MECSLYGGNGNDTLNGGTSDDTMYGGSGDDTLDGSSQHDLMYGGNGNDTLNGGTNDDTMYGDDGADILDGGNQNDSLNGGAGQDTLTGGVGRDAYEFSDLTHSTVAAPDLITDFDQAGLEKILLKDTGIAGFSDLTISNDGVNTYIDHNLSDFQVTLTGVFALTSDDILFIDFINANGTGGALNVTGSAADEYFLANTGGVSDSVDGGGGDDIIKTFTLSDTLMGGAGNDSLYAFTGGLMVRERARPAIVLKPSCR